MNGPPELPAAKKTSRALPHQAAVAGLLAPLLAILVAAAAAANRGPDTPAALKLILGGVGTVLILLGLICSIIALSGIPAHGRRGLLGRGLTGAILNGLFVLTFIVGLVAGLNRSIKSREASRQVDAAVSNYHADLKRSFNPETGLTNIDHQVLDRLQGQFAEAAKNLTGEDALVMQTMSAYFKHTQSGLKKYEAAVARLREAEVLNPERLTEQAQIEPRREIVRAFLEANQQLTDSITDTNRTFATELAKAKVSPAKVEAFMQDFRAKTAPRDALTLQIRNCDRRIGEAMIGILDLFDNHWGKWRYSPALNQVLLPDDSLRRTYNRLHKELDTAGKDQVRLQSDLVNLK
jgi:hypothetical protein